MALLDVFTGRRDPSDRVPPLAKALAGLLTYSKVNGPGGNASYADRLKDIFKPSPTGGPTAQGVIGALLTGGMMDLVRQFRGAGKGDAVDSWVAHGPNHAVSPNDMERVLSEDQ